MLTGVTASTPLILSDRFYNCLSFLMCLFCISSMARETTKRAVPGFLCLVDWWGLLTRLEWALALDWGAGVTKLGPWLSTWPSGVCVSLGCWS